MNCPRSFTIYRNIGIFMLCCIVAMIAIFLYFEKKEQTTRQSTFLFNESSSLAPEKNAAFYLEKARKSLLKKDSEEEWSRLKNDLNDMLEEDTPFLAEISKEQQALFWSAIEAASLCRDCKWNINYNEGIFSILKGINDAHCLVKLVYRKSRESLVQENFPDSIHFWKVGMLISRWIMREEGIVCMSSGLQLEKEGFLLVQKILEKSPEVFCNMQILYEQIPARPLLTECFEKDKQLYLYTMKYRPDILFQALNIKTFASGLRGYDYTEEPWNQSLFQRIMNVLQSLRIQFYFWHVNYHEVEEALNLWYSYCHLPIDEMEKKQFSFLEEMDKHQKTATQKVITRGLLDYQKVVECYRENETLERYLGIHKSISIDK